MGTMWPETCFRYKLIVTECALSSTPVALPAFRAAGRSPQTPGSYGRLPSPRQGGSERGGSRARKLQRLTGEGPLEALCCAPPRSEAVLQELQGDRPGRPAAAGGVRGWRGRLLGEVSPVAPASLVAGTASDRCREMGSPPLCGPACLDVRFHSRPPGCGVRRAGGTRPV